MSDLHLLPCPCCGGEAKRHILTDGGNYIECTGCNLSSRAAYPEEGKDLDGELMTIWNTRQPTKFERYDTDLQQWVAITEEEFATPSAS